MAANGPNNFGIRDNHTRGKVADFLVEKINAGSHLSVVSAYFTIYAYEALSSDDSDIENNITLQPKGKDELKSKEPLNKSSCPRKRASSALIFMDSRFARREAESRRNRAFSAFP
ncbi:MAG: hypothetical protein CVU17_02880 [Betaproteobacteria bacterium HGW-Betaproteobacteria-11]|nr:MAG: hypothetical protein CVU17_02880 [Betaproteobacteria bacterium HGW-Betaproteobacteria-11]